YIPYSFVLLCLFCNPTSPTRIYTLSLHDALPISEMVEPETPVAHRAPTVAGAEQSRGSDWLRARPARAGLDPWAAGPQPPYLRRAGPARRARTRRQYTAGQGRTALPPGDASPTDCLWPASAGARPGGRLALALYAAPAHRPPSERLRRRHIRRAPATVL